MPYLPTVSVLLMALGCAGAGDEPDAANPALTDGSSSDWPAGTETSASPGAPVPGQPAVDPVTGEPLPPGTPVVDPVSGTVIPATPGAPGTTPGSPGSVQPTPVVPQGTGGAGSVEPLPGAGGVASLPAAMGPGVLLDGVCQPLCSLTALDDNGDGLTDAGDTDGWGYEAGASCVIATSTIAMGTVCEPPPPDPSTLPPPGDGFFIDMVCHPPCASAASDDNGDGLVDPMDTDGWGFEQERSCIVVGSTAASQGVPCIPEAPANAPEPGDGFQRDGICYAPCPATVTPDVDGWGYIAATATSCIAPGSTAALQGLPCIPAEVELPEPGDGFQLDGTCYPPCSDATTAATDVDGWGFEDARTCILAGSTAAGMAVACIPPELPPSDTPGVCPVESELNCPNGKDCGCEVIAGLGARKQAILDAVAAQGGDQYMLASAMMETPTLTADYAYGDNKVDDSFNAGIAKQNWGMIRQCHAAWNGMSAGQYATCDVLNDDLALDVTVYKECRDQFGANWFGGHRNGAQGLQQPNTADITLFKTASDWTWSWLQNGHMTDDVRFWADVTPIR